MGLQLHHFKSKITLRFNAMGALLEWAASTYRRNYDLPKSVEEEENIIQVPQAPHWRAYLSKATGEKYSNNGTTTHNSSSSFSLNASTQAKQLSYDWTFFSLYDGEWSCCLLSEDLLRINQQLVSDLTNTFGS